MQPFIIYTVQTQTPRVKSSVFSPCKMCRRTGRAWHLSSRAIVRVNSLNWRADKLHSSSVLWTLLVLLWATELHNEPVDEPRQTTDPVKSQESSSFRNANKWIHSQKCEWLHLMSVVEYSIPFPYWFSCDVRHKAIFLLIYSSITWTRFKVC